MQQILIVFLITAAGAGTVTPLPSPPSPPPQPHLRPYCERNVSFVEHKPVLVTQKVKPWKFWKKPSIKEEWTDSVVTSWKIVTECCDGYRRNDGDKCVATCSSECDHHGDCVAPEQCHCHEGYVARLGGGGCRRRHHHSTEETMEEDTTTTDTMTTTMIVEDAGDQRQSTVARVDVAKEEWREHSKEREAEEGEAEEEEEEVEEEEEEEDRGDEEDACPDGDRCHFASSTNVSAVAGEGCRGPNCAGAGVGHVLGQSPQCPWDDECTQNTWLLSAIVGVGALCLTALLLLAATIFVRWHRGSVNIAAAKSELNCEYKRKDLRQDPLPI